LDNEDLDNEDLDNDDLDNDDLDNEDLDNEDLDNEDLDNEDLDNEDLDNEDLDNDDLDNDDLDNDDLLFIGNNSIIRGESIIDLNLFFLVFIFCNTHIISINLLKYSSILTLSILFNMNNKKL
jgi:uncharacterized protein YjbI with pentapeptide repeats